MRWAITGYYGFGNLGDDLMLYLLLEQLIEIDAEASFTVLLPVGGDVDRIEIPPGARVRFVRKESLQTVWNALGEVDVVLFGGGTCLHHLGSCDLHVNLLGRLRGRRVYWIGVGADCVGRGQSRRRARLSVALCSGATFRDSPSAEVVQELCPRFRNYAVTDDLAYLLLCSPTLGLAEEKRSGGGKALLLSWRDFAGYLAHDDEEAAVDGAASVAARVIRTRSIECVHVLDVCDRVDREANARLLTALRRVLGGDSAAVEVVHHASSGVTGKLAVIAAADYAICARLHGFWAAKTVGAAAVGVGYASKVRNFAESLSTPPVISLAQLMNEPEAAFEVVNAEFSQASTFVKDLSEHRLAALRNIDFVRERVM